MNEEKEQDDLKMFSKDEVAERLKLSPMTVHRLVRDKKLGHYCIGSRVMISAKHVEEFLNRCERAPRTKAAT